jgi:glutathione S-transferase
MWQALGSASTDISPLLGSIFAVVRSKDPHPPTAAMFKDRFKQYLKVWDDTLAKQKYAAGGEMTIADISLYGAYARAKGASPDLCEGLPSLTRWGNDMGARPAMQRALKF